MNLDPKMLPEACRQGGGGVKLKTFAYRVSFETTIWLNTNIGVKFWGGL